jgi:RNA polymerase sigma factor (sigma-70 family)
MVDQYQLVEQFEQHRTHLRVVAYRILGSPHDADDAVQEAWLRLSRADTDDVKNLGGWLSTVVARICLDTLRARRSRREEPLETTSVQDIRTAESDDPEGQAIAAESVGTAMLLVLDTLAPPERVAFVLHDVFGLSFEEIAPVVERSAVAARQLASRARRRIRAGDAAAIADVNPQREVVEAFLAAARGEDFTALVDILDPDAILRSDAAAIQLGERVRAVQPQKAMAAEPQVRGAAAIAAAFAGRAEAAQIALVNGAAGAVWMAGSRPRVIFGFTIIRGRIAEIELIADPNRIEEIDWSHL